LPKNILNDWKVLYTPNAKPLRSISEAYQPYSVIKKILGLISNKDILFEFGINI